jgi:hypothetical protein
MEYINEAYRTFPIRDQDPDLRKVSDLLQAWGAPAREPLHSRLRRRLQKLTGWFACESTGQACESR